jgi:putative addiction module component (TIGR02574 family)
MTDDAKRISAAAKELPPGERLELVEQILESLDASDPSIDQLWAKEAEDRLAAYRRGEIKAVPLSSVLSKYTS